MISLVLNLFSLDDALPHFSTAAGTRMHAVLQLGHAAGDQGAKPTPTAA